MSTSQPTWDGVAYLEVQEGYFYIYCPRCPQPPLSIFERAPREVIEAKKLWLRHWEDDRDSFQAWLRALIAHPLPHLTHLELASDKFAELGDVTPVFQALPWLKGVIIEGRPEFTAPFSAPALEYLQVWSLGKPLDTVPALLRSVMPRLQQFEVLGDNDIPPELAVEFFRRTDLPLLRELRLDGVRGEPGTLNALLQSPIAARLEVLMLPGDGFPEEEAEAVAANKALLTRMKKVHLPDDTWHEELADAPNVEFG